MEQTDLAILGGGSAAFAAAIRAADLGAKDIRIYEEGVVGGTCVNRGCLPTKNLLHAAERYHHYRRPGFPGIPEGRERVDFAAVMAQKDALVEEMRQAKYHDVLAAYPQVRLVPRRARFTGPDRLDVEGVEVTFGAAVVATGASPAMLPISGLAEAEPLTYREALDLRAAPARLAVIGGGPIGLELGQFFARMGSRVTVLEALDRIAPAFEPEVTEECARALASEGMELLTGVRITEVVRQGDERLLRYREAAGEGEVRAEAVLLAAGLSPNTRDMGLEEAGVATDRKGFVQVDAHCRTTNRRIYAAGDCAGNPMLVTTAAYEGAVAAENAIGRLGTRLDESAAPAAVFTDPNLAMVGLTEAAARTGGRRVLAQTLPFQHVPRAGAVRNPTGVIKMVVEDGSYRVLGVHLCAPHAADLIMIGALAVQHRMTLGDLIRALFVYPTFAEAYKLCALAFRRDLSRLSCCAA